MEEVAKNKWNACLQYIQSKLPAGEYSTWFEPLALFKSEGNKLTISGSSGSATITGTVNGGTVKAIIRPR